MMSHPFRKELQQQKKKRRQGKPNKPKRKRTARPFPVVSLKEATQIGEAIFRFASGEKVRRLTLLEKMARAPESSATKMLITNSGKYDITTGSYAAEFLDLTEKGRIVCDPASTQRSRLEAQFDLGIKQIAPFQLLYDTYVGKKLPAHEIMKDKLVDAKIAIDDVAECIDLFVVNIKDLGLLRMIASAETLVSIEQAIEEISETEGHAARKEPARQVGGSERSTKPTAGSRWETICFYIAPIGDEGSESRKHSDLFLTMLVEPALKELGLEVVRADRIAEPGMITSHILEHLRHSRLVVADLSLLNPNVFYEIAIRHTVRLPIVQIIQKADRLPFDVIKSTPL